MVGMKKLFVWLIFSWFLHDTVKVTGYDSEVPFCCECAYFETSQANILLEVMTSLGGNFSSWSKSYSCSDGWGGVCCDGNGYVDYLIIYPRNLGGIIPPILGNLTSLVYLVLSNNGYTGSVPSTLGNLISLEYLYLENNQLSGTIPSQFGNLVNVKKLHLQSNLFSGVIPPTIANATNLIQLNMSENLLTGSIAEEMGNLRYLILLDVSHNLLTGNIPSSLGNAYSFSFLNLNDNYFTGAVPSSLIGLCSKNNLKNNCFSQPSECTGSENVNKSRCIGFCNIYQTGGPCGGNGECVLILFQFKCLCYDGYYLNKTTCVRVKLPIPSPQSSPPVYSSIPSPQFRSPVYSPIRSPLFSPPVYSSFPPLPPPVIRGKSVVTWMIPVTVVIAMFAAACVVCCICRRKFTRKDGKQITANREKCISLDEILEAVQNFSASSVVGHGAFGTVYKGFMRDGHLRAVERVMNANAENNAAFLIEVNMLINMNHLNVIPVIGYCQEKGEQILVYAYSQNGTLRSQLSGNEGILNFKQRINIAIDVVEGLCYLHHEAIPTIIHGDLRSENIILDSDMKAQIFGFGALRGKENKTKESDVYSYGVMLLELMTGLGLTVYVEKENIEMIGIVQYVSEILQWDVKKLVDGKLGENYDIEMLNLIISTAKKCVADGGNEKLSMQEICALFLSLRSFKTIAA